MTTDQPSLPNMHDWALEEIAYSTRKATAKLALRATQPETLDTLVATGVAELIVPNWRPWGPSSSINGHIGPEPADDGLYKLEIEMQSGDIIKITAKAFAVE